MKVKRLVALLMALIMVVGLFAMTAVAASDYPGNCDYCGKKCTCSDGSYTSSTRVDGCSNYSGVHAHTITTRYTTYRCSSCGTHSTDRDKVSFCPYS